MACWFTKFAKSLLPELVSYYIYYCCIKGSCLAGIFVSLWPKSCRLLYSNLIFLLVSSLGTEKKIGFLKLKGLSVMKPF